MSRTEKFQRRIRQIREGQKGKQTTQPMANGKVSRGAVLNHYNLN
jgi:hypothetical protein